ncbi:MAG TPA: BamA/TamA family outer membrane protein, partial [Sphingomonas sanguinis]
DRNQIVDDSLGGRAYYLARAELEVPLGSGAREMGLRPSIYVQAGSLWGVTRPLPSLNFPQARDASGKLLFNKDGSPTLAAAPLVDSQGRQVYQVPSTADASIANQQTNCATGYAPLGSTACTGTTANVALQNTAFAVEEFYGGTWKPRVSIGVGVNWNSPFGPLRIDLAKALVTQPGDDPKLITFNVGTQF